MNLPLQNKSCWKANKLKVFVSHRDTYKVEAKKFSEDLESYGITCFVAHDNIVPMRIWKNEIISALKTMDAFVCFITKDFYESFWTNQEVGFAIAKGVPIYLYSYDKSDPKGFKDDIQAIKTGDFKTLIRCVRDDFPDHGEMRQALINQFIYSKNKSFDIAKESFLEIVDFIFSDKEIEDVVAAIKDAPVYNNQLRVLLVDPIEKEYLERFNNLDIKYYRDLLNTIIAHHSEKRFSLKQYGNGSWYIYDETIKINYPPPSGTR